jgi:hypothetical protein
MRLSRAAAFVFGLAVCGGAAAHETKLSSSRLELAGRAANALVEVNGADLQAALGTELVGADGNLADAALQAAADRIEEYLGVRVRLGAAGVSCPLEEVRLDPAAEHLRARLRFRCPPLGGTLRYEVTLFHEIDPGTRHMVTVSGDARRFGLLSVAAPGMALGRVEASPWEVARHYVVAGVEHIAIGFDHIAFLVAAIVWGRRLWRLAKIVTAFTLAHSVTLSLAALDVLRPPRAPGWRWPSPRASCTWRSRTSSCAA